ncbi:MAG: ribose 5-phosphate isomerase B [Pirellulales bacterium]|nr:ribose 5-phosphate isomerase B [Pirellulales bacterium]
MRIALGGDHRGFTLKEKLAERLQEWGHEAVDLGPNSADSVDYPDFAAAVALQVSSGQVDRGILICGSGLGMCIAANKISGVRAATCHDELSAEMSRRHNDLNVLCLSADRLGEKPIDDMIRTWLGTEFDGGRHQARIDKITALEEKSCS